MAGVRRAVPKIFIGGVEQDTEPQEDLSWVAEEARVFDTPEELIVEAKPAPPKKKK